MNYLSKLQNLIDDNNGTITTRMVNERGIPRLYINKLLDAGVLTKVARGVYITPGTMEDGMLILQTQFSKGIFSYGSALFLHDLTDRVPIYYSMTFPNGYNTSKPRSEGIKTVTAVDKFYDLGIENSKTSNGNLVKVYDREKTICDIVKNKKQLDIQMVTDAIKRYAKYKDKDASKLIDYAKTLGVEDDIRIYMEVLM